MSDAQFTRTTSDAEPRGPVTEILYAELHVGEIVWLRSPRGKVRHAAGYCSIIVWCGLTTPYSGEKGSWLPGGRLPKCRRCVAAMRAEGLLEMPIEEIDALLAVADARPGHIDLTARYGIELRDTLRALRAIRGALGEARDYRRT